MKNMKYGLILGLSLAFVLPAWAETEGDFSFDVADEAATITGYSGSDAVLAIPSTLGGYPVVAIASQAFLETANLTDVLFPDSLLSIGDTAFAGCTALTNVQFGPQLLSIGGSAFASTSIREIVIPDSVTNIGYSAVTPCLEQLVIGDGMTELCCMKFGTNLQNVVIGDGVTNITSGAFQSCAQLTNIVFGANVQDIDSGAFSGCTSLTDFVAPPTLKILKNGPFGGCTGLTNIVLNEGLENMDGSALSGVPIREIVLPSTVTNLGNNPFSGCTALERVDLSAATNLQAIPGSAFAGCSSLVTVDFPVDGALGVLGDSAFASTAIREMAIPDTVTNLGYGVVSPDLEQLVIGNGITDLCCQKFGTNLQNIVIGNGVTNITSGAFQQCPHLTNVVLGANVQHIGEGAFQACVALTTIAIPSSMTCLDNSAFNGCSSLAEIDFSQATNLSVLAYGAFSACTSLSSVELPANLQTIANSPFSGCSSLTNVVLNDGLQTIGDSAFSGLPLASISIPSSVQNLSSSALSGCTALKSIDVDMAHVPSGAFSGLSTLQTLMFGTNVVELGSGICGGCYALEEVVIPDSVTTLGGGMFSSCTNISRIVIGDGVTSIPSGAFSGGLCNLSEVVIGANVQSIGSGAFYNSGLTSIVIPDQVVSVDSGAFSGCSKLTSLVLGDGITDLCCQKFGTALQNVVIGDGVTNITSSAFNDCSQLTNVVLGANVQHIGEGAFQNCTSLTSIAFPPSVERVDNSAFYNCSSLEEIDFSQATNLSMIACGAFSGCSSLSDVELPSNLDTIMGGPFSGCSNLTNIVLNDGLREIGYDSFSGLPLTTLSIPSSVEILSSSALSGCTALTTVDVDMAYIPSGAFCGLPSLQTVTFGTNVVGLGSGIFGGGYALEEVVIPDGVTTIGSGMFGGCTNISQIVIGDGVTNIPSGAFSSGFYNLTNVVIGSSVQDIGAGAFYGASGLQSVTIPASVTNMEASAFGGCAALQEIAFEGEPLLALDAANGLILSADGTVVESSLGGHESVVIPDGVKEIADGVFTGQGNLRSVTLPDSLEIIQTNAFYYCSGLTNVTFGTGLRRIEQAAFRECSALASVHLPDSLEWIGPDCFYNCSALADLDLGTGVTEIGYGAFNYCTSLTSVRLNEGMTRIENNVFEHCYALKDLAIPSTVTSIGLRSFGWSGLTNIALPNGLQAIGDYTFEHCSALASMTIPSTIQSVGTGAFDAVAPSFVDFTGDGIPPAIAASGLLTSNVTMGVSQNLQVFVDACAAGATLAVHAGTYEAVVLPSNRVIHLVSIDGPEAAIIDGDGTNPCAEVDGYSACMAAYNAGDYDLGGQIYDSISWMMSGGASCHSTLTGFRLQNSPRGVAVADLDRCHVTGCEVGAEYANVSQSILDGNDMSAVYGSIYFSTVVSNGSLPYGAYVGYSILWGNATDEWTQCNLTECWTDLMGDPLFVDAAAGNYRLQESSPCVDAVAAWDGLETEIDFDGQPRLAGLRADYGAFELPVREGCWRVKAVAEGRPSPISPAGGVTVPDGDSVTFTAERGLAEFIGWKVDGEIVSTNRTYTWTDIRTNGVLVAVFGPATFWVDASAASEGTGLEEEPMRDLQTALDATLPGDIVKVKPGRYAPITATNQAIVVEAVEGPDMTFIDAMGTGRRCARLVSSYGWCNYSFGYGSSNDWGHASLPDSTNLIMRGFTFCGMDCGYYGENASAAVWGGTLEDCKIIGNKAQGEGYRYGAGAYQSRLKNCLVASNTFSGAGGGYVYGVGLSYCIAEGCEIEGNVLEAGDGGTAYGVGAYECSLSNCVIRGNSALHSYGAMGVGIYQCCLVDGRVEDNVGDIYDWGYGAGAASSYLLRSSVVGNRFEGSPRYAMGGGIYNGTAIACVIANNKGVADGGGSYDAALWNCLVVGNESLEHPPYYYGQGGGVYGGSAYNCAILDNKAHCRGGGAYESNLRNCIVWGNTVQGPYCGDGASDPKSKQVYVYNSSSWTRGSVENCVIEGGTNGGAGTNGVAVSGENPLFVWDIAHPENCRLLAGSPCVDAGALSWSMTNADTAVDMLGNARVQDGAIDIGPVEMGVGYGAGHATVVVDAGVGAVAGTDANGLLDVTSGEGCTLTASTDEALRPFLGWTVNGVDAGTNRTLTLTDLSGVTKVEAHYGPGHIWVEADADRELADGSEAHPLTDLQTALDRALDGDVIHVKAGIYDGVQTWAKKVRVLGEDGAERCIIDPDWKKPCVFVSSDTYTTVACTNTVFENMTLRHGSASNAVYYSTSTGAANMGGIFRHCVIEECGRNESNQMAYGIYEGCVIRRIEGLYFYSFSEMQFRDCLFEENRWSTSLYAGTDGFVNCTFVRNTFGNTSSYSYYLRNCIFWGNEGTLSLADNSVEPPWLCACIQGYTGTVSTIWTEDPQFVDFEHGDYRLRPTSPYINAGWLDAVTTATDVAGQPRVQNKWVDLGAYENPVPEGEHFVMAYVDGDGAVSAWRTLVPDGGSVTLEALPVDAYHPLGYWEVDGVKAGTNTTLALTNVTDDHLVRAFFPDMEFWVDASVRQSGAATSNSPLKTIEEAAAIALDGDTVMVRAGVYAPISVTNGAIRILGVDGAENCIIDGGGTNRCALLGSDVVLEEFTLRNGCATNLADNNGGGVKGGTLYYCILTNNVAYNGGGAYESGLYGCYALGNRAINIGGGIKMSYSRRVENCVVVGNTAGVAGGVDQGYASECNLVGCTIIGNTATNHAGGLAVYSVSEKNGIVRDCIIWGNSAVRSNQNVGVTYWSDWLYYGYTNILINCCVPDFRYGTGLVKTAPSFVRVGNGVRDYYRLAEGSPLIDAGRAGTNDWSRDAAGHARVVGGAPDIGAYEGSFESVCVTFVVDENKCWTGAAQGMLVQNVQAGLDAVLPDVRPYQGWEMHWEGDWQAVTEDRTITAVYEAVPTDWPVVVHQGNLTHDETWEAGVVHVVCGRIGTDGFLLTIEAGAVVKFEPMASLVGDMSDPIQGQGAIFTHLFDDTHGGDTLQDGNFSAPTFGEYAIEWMTGTGNQVLFGTATSITGIEGVVLGGVSIVENTIRVQLGQTLVLTPGTILKFKPGTSLDVRGTLVAKGTPGNPVVFTSYLDDEHGGDTNGDGDASQPGGGDWAGVHVYGTATADHVWAGYAAPRNETGIFATYDGGELCLSNSVFAHALYDGVWNWGGKVRMANCVVLDTGHAVAPYRGENSYQNCVFYQNQYGFMDWSHWVGGSFANCIFANCSSGWSDTNDGEQFQRHSQLRNCLFHNPKDYGPQTCSLSGSSGNLFEDPRFYNAPNDDFRLLEGSPAIDMGDGTSAPEHDAWGQPRVTIPSANGTGTSAANGGIPDVGIYEYPARYGDAGNVDLVAESVSLETTDAAMGDAVTIRVRVVNQGSEDWAGIWADRLELTDVYGLHTYLFMEKLTEARIGAGQPKVLLFKGTLPAMPEGDWQVKVSLNVDRGVFEGQAVSNNVATFTNTLHVTVPAVQADGGAFTAMGNGETLVRLLEISAEGGLLGLEANGVEGMKVWGTSGDVPSAERTWSVLNGAGEAWMPMTSVAAPDAVYLLVQNPGAAEMVTLSLGALETRVTALSPTTLPQSTPAALTLAGLGLRGMTSVELWDGETPVAASTEVTVVSDTKATATFALEDVAPGTYSVKVQVAGEAYDVPGTVEVAAVRTGAKLKAWLEMPTTVRDGRVFTGYVCYQNTGDADMVAPLFSVSGRESTTKLSTTQTATPQANRVYVIGASPTDPKNILKAGESGRVPFYFTMRGKYHIDLQHVLSGQGADPEAYVNTWWKQEQEAAASAASMAESQRLLEAYLPEALEAFIGAYGNVVHDLQAFSVAGRVTLPDGETPVTNETLSISFASGTGGVLAETQTDGNGAFRFEGLVSTGCYAVAGTTVALSDANAIDVTESVEGLELMATSLGIAYGRVTIAEEPVAALGVSGRDSNGDMFTTETDENGCYELRGLAFGTVEVATAVPNNGFAAGVAVLELTSTNYAQEASFSLVQGTSFSGRLRVAGSDEPVGDVELDLYDVATDAWAGRCLTTEASEEVEAGMFLFEGLPVASTMRVVVAGADWQVVDGGDVVVLPSAGLEQDLYMERKPAFQAFPPTGATPLTVAFQLSDAVLAEDVESVQWDFDGDDVADSASFAPTWVFDEEGTFDVSVRLTYADGSILNCTVSNCVKTHEPKPTVYQAGVVVLLEGDAENLGEYVVDSYDEDSGALVLTQVADSPTQVVGNGTILVFRKENGLMRRVRVTATEIEGTTLRLTTELVTSLLQVYRSFEWQGTTLSAAPQVSGRRAGGSYATAQTFTYTKDGSVLKINVKGNLGASMNYQVDAEQGTEEGSIFVRPTFEVEVTGDLDASAAVDFGSFSESLTVEGSALGIHGVLGLTLSGSANGMAGVKGSFSTKGRYSDNISLTQDGATSSPDIGFDSDLNATIYAGGTLDIKVTADLALDTDYGKVNFSGGAALDAMAGGNIGTSGASWSAKVKPKVFAQASWNFGGPKTEELKRKAGDYTQPWVDKYHAAKAELKEKASAAENEVNDVIGGKLEEGKKMVKDAKAIYSKAKTEGLDAAEDIAGEVGAMASEYLPETSEAIAAGMGYYEAARGKLFAVEEMVGVKLGDLRNGREALEKAGRSALSRFDPADVVDPALLGSAMQMLNVDAAMEAYGKAKDMYDQGKYKAKEVKQKLEEKKAEAKAVADDLKAKKDEAIATIEMKKDALKEEARARVGGVLEKANEVKSVVVDYGDQAREQLSNLENQGRELAHQYTQEGLYLMQTTVENAHLSLPSEQLLVQVQNLDIGNAKFPTAAQIQALPMLGETFSVGSSAIWQSMSPDGIGAGFKILSGLNPKSWDSSLDGMSDKWKLEKGLDPTLGTGENGAEGDPDGDGLKNYDEYLGKTSEDIPSPQARARRAKGNDPVWPAENATDPKAADTDEGGVSDMDELLFGLNPLDPSDDDSLCMTCAVEGEEFHGCTCLEKFGGAPPVKYVNGQYHCECGGCPDCQPLDDSEEDEPVESEDPNAIQGPTGFGDPETERYVAPGTELEYTIYFENKADAAAAAQEVWVTLPLDANMDWSTFEAGVVMANNTMDIGLAGVQSGTSQVSMATTAFDMRSSVALDLVNGVATWYLRVVDTNTFDEWPEDPYAGFLPPNTTNYCGEGYVTFKVRAREDLALGDRIAACAEIVFDYNDPIVTDPSWWNLVATNVTVSFGEEGALGEKECILGQELGELPEAEGPEGYLFGGWWTEPDGHGRQVDETTVVGDGMQHLYPLWTLNGSHVTLDPNGGEGGTAEVTAIFGRTMPPATGPTLEHYTFLGYFDATNGGIRYYDGAMQSATNWDQVEPEATLYAQWRGNPSVITLNANGGKAGTAKVTAYYGEPMPKVAKAPYRTGYILQGFYSAKSGGTQYWDGDMKSKRAWNLTKAAYTFYAHWKKSTTTKVTFNANGGKLGTASTTATYGAPMPPATAPTRTGYTFLGYFSAKSGGTKFYDSKMASARKWSSKAKSYTLYAHWSAKKSTVTILGNGGSPESIEATATYGKAMPKIAAPTRTGYNLLGVYSKKSGGTKYWTGAGTSARSWNLTGSKYTFYAQWKLKTTAVTLNPNGGSGGTAKVTATYSKAMPKATAPTRKGYKFLGYYTAKTGGTQYYDAKMASARKWTSSAAKYTLYAQWVRIATITLNSNGGSNGTAKVTATYGKPMPKATAPVRKGYTFLGIFNAKTGGTQYYTETMDSVRNWNGTGTAYTFYAHWAKNATITIDANGGSNGTTKVTAAYGKPMPEATAPVREGYDFLGIFNKRSGGVAYWTSQMASATNWNGTGSSYTFYAQWTLSGLDPENGLLAYNGPLDDDVVADADTAWSIVDGDETTAWTGDEGVGEWHLLLGFDEPKTVGGIQVVGEDLPEDGMTFLVSPTGADDDLESWTGNTSTTFYDLLLSIVKTNGLPPTIQEIYFQPLSEP